MQKPLWQVGCNNITPPRSWCSWRDCGVHASLDLEASVGGPWKVPVHLLRGGLCPPTLEGHVRSTLIDSLPAARLPSLLVIKQQSIEIIQCKAFLGLFNSFLSLRIIKIMECYFWKELWRYRAIFSES